ncbi:MAG: exopolysaccharide biosynthesis protein [Thermosynechococcaceae cyanobacterium]
MARLSAELQREFLEGDRGPTVTLQDVLEIAGERVFGFLFVLLALPSALPVPAPGYSIPFGIVLFLLAAQLVVGSEQPWVPQRFANHAMPLTKVQALLKAGLPWLKRIEAIARPRLLPVCTTFVGRIVLGCAIALMAISMMIPIPGTNTLPAIGIFVTGFGLLEDDGAISLGGLVICLCGLVLSASIIISVVWGGTSLLEWLKGQL